MQPRGADAPPDGASAAGLNRPAARALAAARARYGASAALRDGDGVGHIHIVVPGRGARLRVPRFSQVAVEPEAHLAYLAACFARAAPAGCTPRLIEVVAPADGLPLGALLVEEIAGRLPRLPADLPALAEALARLHGLPAPTAAAPLIDDTPHPLARAIERVRAQAAFLDRGEIAPATVARLRTEITRVAEVARDLPPTQPTCLIAVDCHPGNFLVEASGRAVLVDIERLQYGLAATDLAHATLPSSTLWDPRIDRWLGADDVAGFYRAYARAAGAARFDALAPWLAVCRRLVLVRSLTWFVRFRAETRAGRWSDLPIDPALVAEVDRRIALLLDPERVAAMADGVDAPVL